MRIAQMQETFVKEGNHYHIESKSVAVGLLAFFKPETIWMESDGIITPSGLQPRTYTSRRKLDIDRNARADFDWEHKQITLQNSEGKHTLPLPPGTQDRLSAMYQFMFLTLRPTEKLDFYMTNGGKVDIYNYLVSDNRKVSVPFGKLNANYISTAPEMGAGKTEIWLSVEHDNLPLKMAISDSDGGQLVQVLTKLDIMQ